MLIADVHAKAAHELLAHFNTSPTEGVTPDQVVRARAQYGTNELPSEPPPSIFKLILEQFDDLLVKILLAAAVIDLGLAIINGETGFTALIDPTVIGLILAANAAVGVATESNAAAAIAALREMEAESSRCLRGGTLVTLPVKELVPGDIVEVRVGDKAPADCYVMEIHGAALRVDQSIVTGESGSVDKVAGRIDVPEGAVAQDKVNIVFSGSMITSGSARCLVIGTGTTSAIGKIQDALASTESAPTPLKRKLDEFGAFLSKAIATICVVVWLVNIPNFTAATHGGSWLQGAVYYFQTAVALAVAAIPEGLPAVVTTCLALGTRRMAKQNAIVRTLPAVETLGCTTVICVDKTGTLTTNAMTVARAAIPSMNSHLREFSVSTHIPPPAPGPTRASAAPSIADVTSGTPVDTPADIVGLRVAATIGAVCNDATVAYNMTTGKFSHVGESMEAALCLFAERVGQSSQVLESSAEGLVCDHLRQVHERVATLEFDRERKLMSVAATKGHERVLFVKGAPENVMRRCTSIMGDGGAREPMNAAIQGAVEAMLLRWGREAALRCIALAYKELPRGQDTVTHADESQLVFLGILGLHDPPRQEARTAVQACQEAGIRVIMLTGDNVATAEAVAMQVGILGEECVVDTTAPDRNPLLNHGSAKNLSDQSVVQSMSAADFENLGMDEKREVAAHLRVLARVEPLHKQQLVELLQQDGQVVAMTGDGVNDAPALRKADIGVAMGSGTAVARNSADIVLSDDNVQSIVSAVAEGRRVFANARQFIRYMVSSNIGEVVAIFAAAAGGLPAALSPVQLLWVNLVTDGLPATALSFNEAAPDQMQRKPRSKDDGMVDQWMVTRYAIIGIYVGAATVFGYVWWFLYYQDGPMMPWSALRNSAHCVDSIKTHRAAFKCSIFEDRGPSTIAMSVLVVVEMFNALNAISENSSLLVRPPWANLWLLAAILVSMLLHCAILYIPGLQVIFGVQALSWREWRAVLALSAPVVALDEILKLVSRGAFRNTPLERMAHGLLKVSRRASFGAFKQAFPVSPGRKTELSRSR